MVVRVLLLPGVALVVDAEPVALDVTGVDDKAAAASEFMFSFSLSSNSPLTLMSLRAGLKTPPVMSIWLPLAALSRGVWVLRRTLLRALSIGVLEAPAPATRGVIPLWSAEGVIVKTLVRFWYVEPLVVLVTPLAGVLRRL
jgi:hypothetical protein